MKKYVTIKNPSRDHNKLKIELYYHLGGMNYFTYKTEERGYYISVTPVYSDGIMESVTAFSGIKQCIKPVKRKSEKAYNEVLASINEFLPDLILYVCTKHNIITEDITI